MSRYRFLLPIVLLALGFALGWLGRGRPEQSTALAAGPEPKSALPPRDGKLRIIAFGAHPDDCELRLAGMAAHWSSQGHHVKFVSVTNGDIGHWKQAGGPLARRRKAEVEAAARHLGIQTQVLDIHDGELEPTLEIRRTLTRLIREWHADIVIGHRPNDYHPDHRYTGILVQDAAYMVTVPFFCPDVPHLTKNPVFLSYVDRFERPNPFRADLVVDIDDVIDRRLAALESLESQFYEGGANGSADLLPKDAAGEAARRKQVREMFLDRSLSVARKYRPKLVEIYGKERGERVQHAEAFEVTEYGSQPSRAELLRMFLLPAE
jgi:LmbE family N-acetylglucosaminyl deacetylase